jgi:predicted PurR-regulated permease PerM
LLPSASAPGSEESIHSDSDLLDTPLKDIDDLAEDLQEEAAIEAGVSPEHTYGRPGRPLNRRAPFYVGLTGAFGVATATIVVWALYSIRHLILLLGLAFFIAVGLDPAVRWLRHWVPRWCAVLLVLIGALVVVGGFLALAIPVIVTESRLLPHYVASLSKPHTALGSLNAQYHLTSRLRTLVGGGGGSLVNGVLGVGRVVLGVLSGTLIVVVMAIYLLADLARVKRGLYQMAPRSRRARVVLLTDEIFNRVGGYVLGKIVISILSGTLTYIWVLIFGLPFPFLLAALVALLDLVPIVGSAIGGLIVALVALTVSIPVAIATVAFFVLYKGAEDYALIPKIMGHTVKVPGLVTVVAVIVGGSLLGLIGALVAIPVAAAIQLLIEEVGIPTLDRT